MKDFVVYKKHKIVADYGLDGWGWHILDPKGKAVECCVPWERSASESEAVEQAKEFLDKDRNE